MALDDSPEWRKFPRKGESKGLERGSRPLTHSYHNSGVEVELRRSRRRTRSSARLSRVRRRLYRSGVTRRERATVEALSLMHRILNHLELARSNAVKEVAGKIIMSYLEKRRSEGEQANKTTIINSKEKLAIVIAALRKAIAIHNLPIGESELYDAVASEFEIAGSPEFRNYVWKIMKRMNDYGVTPSYSTYGTPSQRSRLLRIERYIERLLYDLGLPVSLKFPALKFLETAMKSGKSLWGRKPEAVAAAAVYLVARLYGYDDITQKKVASIYRLSEANVRKTFRYLLEDMVVVVGL